MFIFYHKVEISQRAKIGLKKTKKDRLDIDQSGLKGVLGLVDLDAEISKLVFGDQMEN